jgi:hypothetical protein
LSVTRTSGAKPCFLSSFCHEFHSPVPVASSLHQTIENLAFIVDRAPRPELFAANQHAHLVEMPPRSRPIAPTAKLPGDQRAEFQYPSSQRFVGDIQTALGEQIFNTGISALNRALEPLHLAVPPPPWLIRILRSIVFPSPALKPAFDPKNMDGCAV